MATIAQLETEANLAEVTLDYLLAEIDPLTDATTNASQMTRLRNDLEVVNGKFAATATKMYALAADAAELKIYKDAMFPLMRKSAQAMDKANEYLRKQTHTTPPPPTHNPVKLEPIKIPHFSGKYEEWHAFHDLFRSMIHSRTDISGAQKLTYLKTALQGAAAAVITSYEHTDANYQEAWDQLKNRYDVKREIIYAHISTYLDFKPRHSDPDFGLCALVDSINKCIRSLKVQGVPVDDWDCIMIVLALRKLDDESKLQWSLHFKGDVPKIAEFTEYLELRARSLTSTKSGSASAQPKSKPANGKSTHHVSKATDAPKKKSCTKCSGEHRLTECPDFNKLSIRDKYQFMKQKKLCSNCFRFGHIVDDCRNDMRCSKCGNKHHTSLHKDQPEKPVNSSHCAMSSPSEKVVLLGTLLVDVKDSRGLTQQCRVFVDNGSEAHFVSEFCLNRLGLKRNRVNVPLNVVGHKRGPVSKGQVQLKIQSKTEQFSLDINALVLPKFTGLIPATKCRSDWSHFKGITLSDPKYFNPHFTDILLGAAKAGHIMIPGLKTHPTNPEAPVALNTRFGWMVNGESPAVYTRASPLSIHHVAIQSYQPNLDELIAKFWEQEEPETHHKPLSSADVECEKHFANTHTENADGTYTVKLPFRPDALKLGKSREAAVKRFMSVEKRINSEPEVKKHYVAAINEYISLGYIEPVPPADLRKPPHMSYYMPHHIVIKPSSSSTKYRVVYDAGAKTTNKDKIKVSLNNTLYTGPKLQIDLCPLLLRFMTFPIVISADLWKFYPQTSVHEDHRDFQRLVWREEPEQSLQDLRLTRVTFGVSAAPFLAIRAFHELANKIEATHPRAAQVMKEEFLVDNLLTGGHTVAEAVQLKNELLEATKIGGLKLLKFMSNSEPFLQSLPPELRDPSTLLPIDEGDFVKTIGILWNPKLDIFRVNIEVPEPPIVTTKRTVLSTIARTFDPLGWLSPVTVTPKILIQNLWKAGLGWDEPLPLHFHQDWRKYCEELSTLQGFSLPRNAFAAPDVESTELTHQLHGFSDGSDQAFAACVYIRTQDSQGRAATKLLTAKTRVNPIQKPTTPRSELCGALLLTNLISTVLKSVKTEFTSTHCWTDSTVVLGRISPEKKLPIYELNRIRKILNVLPPEHWKHVKGDENPADAPSRGINPRQLLNHPLWLHGPKWLQNYVADSQPISAAVATIQPQPVTKFLQNTSDFILMQRTLAFWVRFIHNARTPKQNRRKGRITAIDMQDALMAIVKVVQREAFPKEIRDCSRGLLLKERLKRFTPFIRRDGILRVGGRLENADIPYSHKHQALLPKAHHVVDVIAKHYHEVNLHAGPTLLLSILREQLWPVGGLHLTKRIVRNCITCQKHQAKPAKQLMGQLPSTRVNQAPTFSQVGVDYAGPFSMALRSGRKPPIIKAHVAIFVCMATKATHLELVSDLSSPAFIAALTRFLSRRGLPNDVYSDRGTNFIGAKNELKELLDFVNSAAHIDKIRNFLAPKGITFHTNPPVSPHHGGLWEAAVKSMKHHLRRVMGDRNMTSEEFRTLLCQIEAMLNSRPLTPMSNDPNDMTALTPGHFLIGRPLCALPYPDLGHLSLSRLDRWQTVQCVSQHIWYSWKRAYLSLLQSRPKWYTPLPDLTIGTMVLIMDKDSSLGPQQWKLGRIVDVFPGDDGKTRVCAVRTNCTMENPKGIILRRPVVKLSPLPVK